MLPPAVWPTRPYCHVLVARLCSHTKSIRPCHPVRGYDVAAWYVVVVHLIVLRARGGRLLCRREVACEHRWTVVAPRT